MISEAGAKVQKFKLQKKLKYILYNVKSTYKAEATATFSILALISEIWALKIKNDDILGINVQLKKVLECVLGHPLNIFLLYGPKFMYFFGSLVDLNQKQPLIQILKNMVVAFMHI